MTPDPLRNSECGVDSRSGGSNPGGSDGFDLGILEELRELAGPDNPDPLREVLGLFLSDSPVRDRGLVEAWKSRDVKQMHACAHALKGSAANLGASRLMNLLADLDRDLKHGALDNATPLMALIEVEFREAMRFLEEYLRQHCEK